MIPNSTAAKIQIFPKTNKTITIAGRKPIQPAVYFFSFVGRNVRFIRISFYTYFASPPNKGTAFHVCFALPMVKGTAFHVCFALPMVKGTAFHPCFALPMVKGTAFHSCFALPMVKGTAFHSCFALPMVKGGAFHLCVYSERSRTASTSEMHLPQKICLHLGANAVTSNE